MAIALLFMSGRRHFTMKAREGHDLEAVDESG
jgi:hypothetical protein